MEARFIKHHKNHNTILLSKHKRKRFEPNHRKEAVLPLTTPLRPASQPVRRTPFFGALLAVGRGHHLTAVAAVSGVVGGLLGCRAGAIQLEMRASKHHQLAPRAHSRGGPLQAHERCTRQRLGIVSDVASTEDWIGRSARLRVSIANGEGSAKARGIGKVQRNLMDWYQALPEPRPWLC